MFQQSLESFGGISLLQISAFQIPFVIAVFIDLKSHKKGQTITMRDAAIWSVIWVFCALSFGAFIYWNRGSEAASLYVTGYVLEKAFSG